MYLYKDSNLIQTFLIALGKNPKGPKTMEGDKKTPEGTYTLDYIKRNTKYYKAFHISYPNVSDIKKAKSLGIKPGSMIMIHGQPSSRGGNDDTTPGIQSSNWTNGCIALMNYDMDKFVELVDPGTEIIIEP
jgi:murein L,D-transpeptidase YafK